MPYSTRSIARPNLTVWVLALTAATSLGVFRLGRPFCRQPKFGLDVAPFSPTPRNRRRK